MIELVQQKNLLIGSKDAINNLAHMDHGRILIASDSHNHFDILQDIIKRYGPSCNAMAFCGDGLSDIAHIYTLASQDDEFRNAIPPVMAFVAGNCDPSFYPLSLEQQIIAPYKQIITVNNQNILIVHGHRENVDYGFSKLGLEMKLNNCKTSLFGHTHIAEEVCIKGFKFVNPGSCANPRGGQPPSFAILTVEKTFTDTAFIKIDKTEDDKYKLWQPN